MNREFRFGFPVDWSIHRPPSGWTVEARFFSPAAAGRSPNPPVPLAGVGGQKVRRMRSNRNRGLQAMADLSPESRFNVLSCRVSVAGSGLISEQSRLCREFDPLRRKFPFDATST